MEDATAARPRRRPPAAAAATNEAARLLAGTGLNAGSKLPNLVGSEYDRVTSTFPDPNGVELVLHSPLRCRFHDSF